MTIVAVTYRSNGVVEINDGGYVYNVRLDPSAVGICGCPEYRASGVKGWCRHLEPASTFFKSLLLAQQPGRSIDAMADTTVNKPRPEEIAQRAKIIFEEGKVEVDEETDTGTSYAVVGLNGKNAFWLTPDGKGGHVCDCHDWAVFHKDDPNFHCEHHLALTLYLVAKGGDDYMTDAVTGERIDEDISGAALDEEPPPPVLPPSTRRLYENRLPPAGVRCDYVDCHAMAMADSDVCALHQERSPSKPPSPRRLTREQVYASVGETDYRGTSGGSEPHRISELTADDINWDGPPARPIPTHTTRTESKMDEETKRILRSFYELLKDTNQALNLIAEAISTSQLDAEPQTRSAPVRQAPVPSPRSPATPPQRSQAPSGSSARRNDDYRASSAPQQRENKPANRQQAIYRNASAAASPAQLGKLKAEGRNAGFGDAELDEYIYHFHGAGGEQYACGIDQLSKWGASTIIDALMKGEEADAER
jgi:hypothetical protein